MMQYSVPEMATIAHDQVGRHRHDFPVLLVDDDLVYRELATLFLKDAGYMVDTVSDASEAITALAEKSYPIVMCDWMMPGMDGLDLCKLLRSSEQAYRYIIMLTSKNEGDEIVQGLRAGADDYIVKGGRKSELIARLDCGLRVVHQNAVLEAQKQEILKRAQSDHLTATFNRGYLNERLPAELSRAKRYSEPLSVILCDIDHFKSINDTYGHLGGDKALVEFAELLTTSIRHQVDWVARYGGEEFVIVLPNTAHSQAMRVAEKLRRWTEQSTVSWEDTQIKFTASFGVSTFQGEESTRVEDLLAIADERLYLSKTQGRNRCTGEQ